MEAIGLSAISAAMRCARYSTGRFCQGECQLRALPVLRRATLSTDGTQPLLENLRADQQVNVHPFKRLLFSKARDLVRPSERIRHDSVPMCYGVTEQLRESATLPCTVFVPVKER